MSVTSWAFASASSAGAAPRAEPGQALGRLGPLLLVAARLGARLPHEQLDLGELAVQPSSSRSSVARASRRSRGQARAGCGQVGHDGRQSSGIRIQPWRIAYTTAWVRSLTASFRRIELMWFLTVCSLIESW